jgi:hypothetical protein
MAELTDVDLRSPEQIPPQYRNRTRFLCGDSMANWLWAYWQGRFQGAW